ncbi:IDEAL domain-containing protein [Peribacillus glennii]|uniref:IDEAL domain-containing protein n=1 Tax=Peribacillus glennii TaxID=2303991 RepID=A0A372LKA0_9BACI|nr:IDEAL domain-containing protein [Peribacillus glennii]RFU66636.1 IDEAL domain-containing protein [Peribacillus glennii]
MAMNGKNQFETSDWVMGKSKEGELVTGYIESVDVLQGIVKVFVIESDNERIIGKSISLQNKSVEKLSVSQKMNEQQLLDLIDVALLTKDEQWFTQLTAKLNELRKAPKKESTINIVYPADIIKMEKFDTGH